MIRTILRIQYLRLRNNPTELLLVFVMPMIFFSIFVLGFLIRNLERANLDRNGQLDYI